ncbi:unnamed protein product [Pleuronectes platessa]|uniref:Uncharacterized protein n=1 Tax=Pleuronectes platessa TaxID=8262 RepID=A0A9N7YI32_PLEPL|nr:unnamed protein product [Pleuronectes platessa]
MSEDGTEVLSYDGKVNLAGRTVLEGQRLATSSLDQCAPLIFVRALTSSRPPSSPPPTLFSVAPSLQPKTSVMVQNGSCSPGLSGLSLSHTNQEDFVDVSGSFTASPGAPLIYESFPNENTTPQLVLIYGYL